MRTLEELELGYRRVEAAQACRNLMGRYSHGFATGDVEGLMALFSQRKDIRLRLDRAYEGRGAVRACLARQTAPRHGDGPLTLKLLGLDTAVIEVAGDGESAKGCWTCPGHETTPPGVDRREGRAVWHWARCAADFVREPDGSWRIWHLQFIRLFSADWDEPWTDHPWPENAWRPEGVFPLTMPLLPEPYERLEDTFLY